MASYSFPWNQVNSLVQDFIVPNIRDQFFKSNAFYHRARNRVKKFSGGRAIVQPLAWKAEGGGGGWFSGTDVLDTTIRDPIQSAVWMAKNAYVPISISWEDEKLVQGPTMVKSLVETKGEIARHTAIDLIGTDLFNDGTDGKRLTGLQYALRDFTGGAPGVLPAQTYGGIARQGRNDGGGGGTQTNNWWVHLGDNTAYDTAAAGNFDPLTPGKVHGVIGKMWAQIGIASGKQPTLMVSNWGAFTAYHNALSLNDRYMRPQQNSELAKAGYRSLMYNNAAWVVDERAPRSSAKIEKIYFINEDTVRLYIHSDADFAYEGFRKPHNQMARVAYILFRGELCVIEPRGNGVISSVDTSAVS
jgi:hypothetical protein